MLRGLVASLGGAGAAFERAKNAGKNKDVIEAMVAGCVIVGASDGDFSSKEQGEAQDAIMVSKFVEVAGIDVSTVSALLNQYAAYRPGSFSGRTRLLKEIREAGARPGIAEFHEPIFYAWLDVAGADGTISTDERKALIECANAIGYREAESITPPATV